MLADMGGQIIWADNVGRKMLAAQCGMMFVEANSQLEPIIPLA